MKLCAVAPLNFAPDAPAAPRRGNRPVGPLANPQLAEGLAAVLPGRPRLTFDLMFPIAAIVFANDIQEPMKPWSDGTTVTTLAAALVPVGDTGATIPCRVVRKVKGNTTTFDLMFPSSGAAFRRPMIDTKHDDNARRDFDTYRKLAADAYITWRTAQVKAGASTIKAGGSVSGAIVDNDLMKSLGIE